MKNVFLSLVFISGITSVVSCNEEPADKKEFPTTGSTFGSTGVGSTSGRTPFGADTTIKGFKRRDIKGEKDTVE